MATAELRIQNKNHSRNYKIRAKQLGNFLAKTEAVEIVLQRLRDEQAIEVFRVIEGGIPNVIPFTTSSTTVEQTVTPESKPKNLVDDNSNSDLIKPKQFRRFNKY